MKRENKIESTVNDLDSYSSSWWSSDGGMEIYGVVRNLVRKSEE